MRKLLFITLAIFFLSSCAPNVPDGLKKTIESAHPNAQYLEAKSGHVTQKSNLFWCVAYKPEPSEQIVFVEIYYDTSWILLNEAWAQDIRFSDDKPNGGWCQRMTQY